MGLDLIFQKSSRSCPILFSTREEDVPVLPKHTLFKVLYLILVKFKNNTLFILFSVKYF